jgi:hypothetical protein
MNPTKLLLLTGSVVLLSGLLSGAPMGRAIVRKLGDDVVRGWRVAHTGLTMGGIMILTVALALPVLALSPILTSVATWAFVISSVGFTIGLPIGAWKGQRGLRSKPQGMNTIVYLGNMLGAWGSLVGTVLMIFGAWNMN